MLFFLGSRFELFLKTSYIAQYFWHCEAIYMTNLISYYTRMLFSEYETELNEDLIILIPNYVIFCTARLYFSNIKTFLLLPPIFLGTRIEGSLKNQDSGFISLTMIVIIQSIISLYSLWWSILSEASIFDFSDFFPHSPIFLFKGFNGFFLCIFC